MKIALINVSGELSSEGSRLISALLKNAGHIVKSVFLVRDVQHFYNRKEIEQLQDIFNDIELVMIAVYSKFVQRAVQVSEFVHKNYPEIQVIWGGPHCVSAPELSLNHADGVCFAEGDRAVVDFVNKMEQGADYTSSPNMAFNIDGKFVVNKVLPPFSNLDSLPHPDYAIDDHFLLDRKLNNMTKQLLQQNYPTYPFGVPTYWCLTSRGCPHNCSYCNNCRYISMYGRNPIRFRSVDHFLDEIDHFLKTFDFVETIGFGDDDFFARPLHQLEDFQSKYKKRIGRPFFIAVSANTYRREKMELLLDAGLKVVEIGVQSGSQRVLDEVFNRRISVKKTIDVMNQVEPYIKTHDLQLMLDFIIDTPYETEDDIMHTYRYFLDIPKETVINLFVLNLSPGTELYDRAIQDGYIEEFDYNSFRDYCDRDIVYQNNYNTFLVLLVWSLHTGKILKYVPRIFLEFLGSRFMVRIAHSLPEIFYKLLNKAVFIPSMIVSEKTKNKIIRKRIGI